MSHATVVCNTVSRSKMLKLTYPHNMIVCNMVPEGSVVTLTPPPPSARAPAWLGTLNILNQCPVQGSAGGLPRPGTCPQPGLRMAQRCLDFCSVCSGAHRQTACLSLDSRGLTLPRVVATTSDFPTLKKGAISRPLFTRWEEMSRLRRLSEYCR